MASLLTLPISIGLFIWILRMKKDNPFPKGTIIRFIIAGILSLILSSIVTIIGSIVLFIFANGLDTLKALFDPAQTAQVAEQLAKARELNPENVLYSFIRTFIFVGFCEEIFKFLCAKLVMKRPGVVHTWMDAIFSFALVAIVFQVIEDIMYSSGSVITAIVRAITPFHFAFSLFVGYYYGLAKTTGKKFYYFLALFVPSLLHTIFDFSIKMLQHNDSYFFLFIITTIGLLIFTVVMVLKIRKWHKNKTLDIPIEV